MSWESTRKYIVEGHCRFMEQHSDTTYQTTHQTTQEVRKITSKRKCILCPAFTELEDTELGIPFCSSCASKHRIRVKICQEGEQSIADEPEEIVDERSALRNSIMSNLLRNQPFKTYAISFVDNNSYCVPYDPEYRKFDWEHSVRSKSIKLAEPIRFASMDFDSEDIVSVTIFENFMVEPMKFYYFPYVRTGLEARPEPSGITVIYQHTGSTVIMVPWSRNIEMELASSRYKADIFAAKHAKVIEATIELFADHQCQFYKTFRRKTKKKIAKKNWQTNTE